MPNSAAGVSVWAAHLNRTMLKANQTILEVKTQHQLLYDNQKYLREI